MTNVLSRDHFWPSDISREIIELMNEMIKDNWTGNKAVVSVDEVCEYLSRSPDYLIREWRDICAYKHDPRSHFVGSLSAEMVALKRAYEAKGWIVNVKVDHNHTSPVRSITFA